LGLGTLSVKLYSEPAGVNLACLIA
jgi:hypothetical protein